MKTYPTGRKARKLYLPRAMREAPPLDPSLVAPPATPRTVLLINPFYPKDPHASFGKHVLTPTLALTSFAATTPPHWSVRYWDENLLQGPPPAAPFPQVVGITVHLTFARRAFELARWYRERGSTIVLGGLHVLSCPDECEPHADALVLGEGVQVWPQVLADLEHGTLRQRYLGSYARGPLGEYRDEPAPRRDILPRWGFLTTGSLIATRGCHNRCGFCYLATDGLHIPYQTHHAEEIARQLEAADEPYGVFIDNNLGSRHDYLRALSRAMGRTQKIWSAAVSLDVTDDADLVRDMALGGCTSVFVGFESLSGENLDEARKKSPRPADYARRVELFHRNGIQVNGSFVFGFDHDGPDVFEKTVEWIEANRLECATFHILTPYPATPLFRQLEAEGRLRHRDWSLYDTCHVVFQPKRLSPEELYEGYAWAYRQVFSHASIWRRRPSDPRAVPAYLAMSYLYKRSNRLWPFLIRHRLTHLVWRPLVEVSRRRHVRFRRRLGARKESMPEVGLPVGGLS